MRRYNLWPKRFKTINLLKSCYVMFVKCSQNKIGETPKPIILNEKYSIKSNKTLLLCFRFEKEIKNVDHELSVLEAIAITFNSSNKNYRMLKSSFSKDKFNLKIIIKILLYKDAVKCLVDINQITLYLKI
ncbi:hypothetical protein BpHYR1_014005 [Brachionus plicatilis]|uniref:Uncharacterized protein n=1 Tax=Brachionus plicatilis TaxID=10195 RepID=A0A3M7QT45_BRAPC|nr:hypothetical protein BpHYR1_014005 [Brachionus plicatilis]